MFNPETIEVVYKTGERELFQEGAEIDAGSNQEPDTWKGLTIIREPNGDVSYRHIETIREIRAL